MEQIFKFNNLQNYTKREIAYDELVEATGLNDIQYFDGLKNKSKGTVTRVCPKHGTYTAAISSLLKGKTSCRKCVMEELGKSRRNTVEEFREKFKKTDFSKTITPHYENYHKMSEPMPFTCNVCGAEFNRQPSNFLNGVVKFACPVCGKKQQAEAKTKTD